MTDTEITRHLAEKVMGWELEIIQDGSLWAHSKNPEEGPWPLTGPSKYKWDPLRSISDAMECLEAWKAMGPHRSWAIGRHPYNGKYWCSLTGSAGQADTRASMDTSEQAICAALLQTTGFKEEK